jgi:hypothetical protein
VKSILLVAAIALLCGCNANLGLQIGSVGRSATTPSVGPGGSFSSSGASLRFGDAPGVGSLLGAIGLGWLFGRDSGGRDSRNEEMRTPPLDDRRSINEQDCSLALADPAANLRCR